MSIGISMMQTSRRASMIRMPAMEQEIKAVCQDSWDFADASPEPPIESLYEDVLVTTES